MERGQFAPDEARHFSRALRTTRRELAKAAGVPPYIITTDRTLWDMVDWNLVMQSLSSWFTEWVTIRLSALVMILDAIDRFNVA